MIVVGRGVAWRERYLVVLGNQRRSWLCCCAVQRIAVGSLDDFRYLMIFMAKWDSRLCMQYITIIQAIETS
jgi:hypothetical protein